MYFNETLWKDNITFEVEDSWKSTWMYQLNKFTAENKFTNKTMKKLNLIFDKYLVRMALANVFHSYSWLDVFLSVFGRIAAESWITFETSLNINLWRPNGATVSVAAAAIGHTGNSTSTFLSWIRHTKTTAMNATYCNQMRNDQLMYFSTNKLWKMRVCDSTDSRRIFQHTLLYKTRQQYEHSRRSPRFHCAIAKLLHYWYNINSNHDQ